MVVRESAHSCLKRRGIFYADFDLAFPVSRRDGLNGYPFPYLCNISEVVYSSNDRLKFWDRGRILIPDGPSPRL